MSCQGLIIKSILQSGSLYLFVMLICLGNRFLALKDSKEHNDVLLMSAKAVIEGKQITIICIQDYYEYYYEYYSVGYIRKKICTHLFIS